MIVLLQRKNCLLLLWGDRHMDPNLRESIKLQELGNGLRDGTAMSWLFCYQDTQSKVDPLVNREEMQILRKKYMLPETEDVIFSIRRH